MPYLWHLARRYGYASDWSAITHPSLPNYLADPPAGPRSTTRRIPAPPPAAPIRRRPSSARLWPSARPPAPTRSRCPCRVTGRTAAPTPSGTTHGPTSRARPPPAAPATSRPASVPGAGPGLGRRAGTLPSVGLITPNLINDAHDGTLGQADAWLRMWIPVIMSGPDWRHGRLAIAIVFDLKGRPGAAGPVRAHRPGTVRRRPTGSRSTTTRRLDPADRPGHRRVTAAPRLPAPPILPDASASRSGEGQPPDRWWWSSLARNRCGCSRCWPWPASSMTTSR